MNLCSSAFNSLRLCESLCEMFVFKLSGIYTIHICIPESFNTSLKKIYFYIFSLLLILFLCLALNDDAVIFTTDRLPPLFGDEIYDDSKDYFFTKGFSYVIICKKKWYNSHTHNVNLYSIYILYR